ncbi:MAG TPA: ATP-binding protein [Actinomycetota bacterium]|nr:ATP-binding protein [Actinomycetota bacterium]
MVEPLELEIPPEAEYVGAARLFLAAVGRHFALDEESVADMKMAVSEVCAGAAEDLRTPGVLRITVLPADDAIEVEVAPVNGTGRGAHDGLGSAALSWETALREPLVRALFPDSSYDAAAHVLRLSVPRETAAATE